MALWGGRFSKDTDKQVAKFTESVSYDQRLYPYDIQGSIAHVTMLAKQKIISKNEADIIIAELKKILQKLDDGSFPLSEQLEDIHMNIEAALIHAQPEIGAKVHTGRSRNDQVNTDERLYLREEADNIVELLSDMQRALIVMARSNDTAILPGLTHLQHAQPVLFAHHLLAYVEMFARDKERMQDCRKRINRSPLGAGALAGSTLPLDREYTAQLLGFDAVLRNSMDAVADRDYIVEFLATLSLISMHISRISEDIIHWASQQYNFIDLDDAFCTGSSLMPQKKNPDVAEIARGKTGRVYASLVGMLTILKGLPLTYNRDLQEDKEGIFDAIDTVKMVLSTVAAMIATTKIKADVSQKAASSPELMATDLAEWLVLKEVPFRDAHHMVGRYVALCQKEKVALNKATLKQMQQCIPIATEECFELFSAEKSVNARDILGGTAPKQVHKQLEYWEQILEMI